jgi:NAD(P)-dependent dehydrogenase (short-subunit alcohol dehydrogenase family)
MIEMNGAPCALVTGANRGLGFETCRQLARHGYHTIVASRQRESGKQAADRLRAEGLDVESMVLDVTNPHSRQEVLSYLQRSGKKIHLLINNAGVSLDGFDGEIVKETLSVNVESPLHLTQRLLPVMANGSVVVMVSSGMGELSCLGKELQEQWLDPQLTLEGVHSLLESFALAVEQRKHSQAGWPSSAYRVSKVALNSLVRVLAPQLSVHGIAIRAVCPGWVRTAMGGSGAERSIPEGAASIVQAALLPNETTGGFYRDGQPIAW